MAIFTTIPLVRLLLYFFLSFPLCMLLLLWFVDYSLPEGLLHAFSFVYLVVGHVEGGQEACPGVCVGCQSSLGPLLLLLTKVRFGG